MVWAEWREERCVSQGVRRLHEKSADPAYMRILSRGAVALRANAAVVVATVGAFRNIVFCSGMDERWRSSSAPTCTGKCGAYDLRWRNGGGARISDTLERSAPSAHRMSIGASRRSVHSRRREKDAVPRAKPRFMR